MDDIQLLLHTCVLYLEQHPHPQYNDEPPLLVLYRLHAITLLKTLRTIATPASGNTSQHLIQCAQHLQRAAHTLTMQTHSTLPIQQETRLSVLMNENYDDDEDEEYAEKPQFPVQIRKIDHMLRFLMQFFQGAKLCHSASVKCIAEYVLVNFAGELDSEQKNAISELCDTTGYLPIDTLIAFLSTRENVSEKTLFRDALICTWQFLQRIQDNSISELPDFSLDQDFVAYLGALEIVEIASIGPKMIVSLQELCESIYPQTLRSINSKEHSITMIWNLGSDILSHICRFFYDDTFELLNILLVDTHFKRAAEKVLWNHISFSAELVSLRMRNILKMKLKVGEKLVKETQMTCPSIEDLSTPAISAKINSSFSQYKTLLSNCVERIEFLDYAPFVFSNFLSSINLMRLKALHYEIGIVPPEYEPLILRKVLSQTFEFREFSLEWHFMHDYEDVKEALKRFFERKSKELTKVYFKVPWNFGELLPEIIKVLSLETLSFECIDSFPTNFQTPKSAPAFSIASKVKQLYIDSAIVPLSNLQQILMRCFPLLEKLEIEFRSVLNSMQNQQADRQAYISEASGFCNFIFSDLVKKIKYLDIGMDLDMLPLINVDSCSNSKLETFCISTARPPISVVQDGCFSKLKLPASVKEFSLAFMYSRYVEDVNPLVSSETFLSQVSSSGSLRHFTFIDQQASDSFDEEFHLHQIPDRRILNGVDLSKKLLIKFPQLSSFRVLAEFDLSDEDENTRMLACVKNTEFLMQSNPIKGKRVKRKSYTSQLRVTKRRR